MIAVASTAEMWPVETMTATIGMRITASALLNVNDFAKRSQTPEALSRMSWKTNRSCSRKLPTIVASAAMIAATM
ncbi:hypothetical protein D3C87_1902550 [compost metagenome]